MEKIILSVIVMLFAVNIYGQEVKVIYFNANNEVSDSENYAFKRELIKTLPRSIDIKDYYYNGNLRLQCTCITPKNYDLTKFEIENIKAIPNIKLNGAYIKYYQSGAKRHEFTYKKGKVLKSLNYMANGDVIYFIVDRMPQFPGGDEKLRNYILSAVKYPKEASDRGIQGKVYISFVVNKQGSVVNVAIARGVDPLLDNEALRVIKAMPKWIPGTNNGELKNVSYTIPVDFK